MTKSDEVNLYFKGRFVLIELEGRLSTEKILEASEKLIVSGNFPADFPLIWDTSKADWSYFDCDSIEQTVKSLSEQWKDQIRNRIGLVSEDDLSLSSVQLFREYCELNGKKVDLFLSFTDAEKWAINSKC
ncbi:hypothetical protein KJ966_15770 [bacterium]|nr:hypothetical protein [bacterium]